MEFWNGRSGNLWRRYDIDLTAKIELVLSEKGTTFSDSTSMRTKAQGIDTVILKSARGTGRGAVFTARHFLHLGSRDAVDQALSRLARHGAIRRVRRGVYDLPKTHPLLGVLSPDPMAVIKAVLDSTGVPWQVAGAYAANAIGISDQVPAKVVVLTAGKPRKLQVGKTTIYVRRAAPRYLLAPGTTTGLVFQGLRWMGKDGVTDAIVNDLRKRLNAGDKKQLADLHSKMPAWMQPLVRRICATE
ncbi:MAG: DUF6088 family protein [Verrucomicrobiia bacterium]